MDAEPKTNTQAAPRKSPQDPTPDASRWPCAYRLAGLLPLSFFLVRLIDYIRDGTPSHMFWNCHVANLLLAVGLFFAVRGVIRAASLWLVLGIPPWIYDMFVINIFDPLAFYTHVGGFLAAIWIVSRIGMAQRTWIVALAAHLIWQQVTRVATPPVYNVNISQGPYQGFEHLFSSYWQYWLAAALLAAASLFLVELALRLLLPAPKSAEAWS